MLVIHIDAGETHPLTDLTCSAVSPQGRAARRSSLGSVGAVTSLGLRLLRTDLWPAASRAADARRAVARHLRKMAFIDRDHDNRLDHQARADSSDQSHGSACSATQSF